MAYGGPVPLPFLGYTHGPARSVIAERTHAHTSPLHTSHTHFGVCRVSDAVAFERAARRAFPPAPGAFSSNVSTKAFRLTMGVSFPVAATTLTQSHVGFAAQPSVRISRVEGYDSGRGPPNNHLIGHDNAAWYPLPDTTMTANWTATIDTDNMSWVGIVPIARPRTHMFMNRHITFPWTVGYAHAPPLRCCCCCSHLRNADLGPACTYRPLALVKVCLRHGGDAMIASVAVADGGDAMIASVAVAVADGDDDKVDDDDEVDDDEVDGDDDTEGEEEEVPPATTTHDTPAGGATSDETPGALIFVVRSLPYTLTCTGSEDGDELQLPHTEDTTSDVILLTAAVADNPPLLLLLCVISDVAIDAELAGRYSNLYFIRRCMEHGAAKDEDYIWTEDVPALLPLVELWQCMPVERCGATNIALGSNTGGSNAECILAFALGLRHCPNFDSASGVGDVLDMHASGYMRFFVGEYPLLAMQRAMGSRTFTPYSLCLERTFNRDDLAWSAALPNASRVRDACRRCGRKSTRWAWVDGSADVRLCSTCTLT